jgi:Ion channel
MMRQVLVGAAVSLCNIAIHAFLMAAVVWAARTAVAIPTFRQSHRLIAVMIATVSFLMAAHLVEVLVWALAYAIVGVAPEGTDLIYFSFVNYTTLGYGDVTPEARWHLLGPMTAMNGVLLFGWSTAVIFEVLRRVMTTIRSDEGRGEGRGWPE